MVRLRETEPCCGAAHSRPVLPGLGAGGFRRLVLAPVS